MCWRSGQSHQVRRDECRVTSGEKHRRDVEKKVTVVTLCALLLALNSSVQAQSNFFQGKSIRVIRGGQPGDLYDLWTRHIATYLGKHVAGSPSIMVQNMPGAGSVIAANYVYNVA